MAALARFYPRGPVNVAARLKSLPEDGSVPGMPGWRWIHTPGHSVGHVSFWRESDRAIIAGDAFVTTDQESAYAVAVQKAQMHGPPMYYTVEWDKAKASVERLAALEPDLVITGHGEAMRGPEMRAALAHPGARLRPRGGAGAGRLPEGAGAGGGRLGLPALRRTLHPLLLRTGSVDARVRVGSYKLVVLNAFPTDPAPRPLFQASPSTGYGAIAYADDYLTGSEAPNCMASMSGQLEARPTSRYAM